MNLPKKSNDNRPDYYYGSEKHFQDLQESAGKTGYFDHPETMEEAGHNLRQSFKELSTALGLSRALDYLTLKLGQLLRRFNRGL